MTMTMTMRSNLHVLVIVLLCCYCERNLCLKNILNTNAASSTRSFHPSWPLHAKRAATSKKDVISNSEDETDARSEALAGVLHQIERSYGKGTYSLVQISNTYIFQK